MHLFSSGPPNGGGKRRAILAVIKRHLFLLFSCITLLSTTLPAQPPPINYTWAGNGERPAIVFLNQTGYTIEVSLFTQDGDGVVFDSDLRYDPANSDIIEPAHTSSPATLQDDEAGGFWRPTDSFDGITNVLGSGRIGAGRYSVKVEKPGSNATYFTVDFTDAYWIDPGVSDFANLLLAVRWDASHGRPVCIGYTNPGTSGAQNNTPWITITDYYNVTYWDVKRVYDPPVPPGQHYKRGRTGYPQGNISTFFTFDNALPNGEIPPSGQYYPDIVRLDVHVNMMDQDYLVPEGKTFRTLSDEDIYLEDDCYETKLNFEPGISLIVRGTLSTDFWTGVSVFKPNTQPRSAGDWNGIVVENNGVLDMKGAQVEYAVDGILVSGSGSVADIRDTWIKQCDRFGLNADAAQDLRFTWSIIDSCNSHGVNLDNSGSVSQNVLIEGCTIRENVGDGIHAANSSSVYVNLCRIHVNDNGINAIDQSTDTWITIQHSKVHNNVLAGLRAEDANIRGFIPGTPDPWSHDGNGGFTGGLNCVYDNLYNLLGEQNTVWEFGKGYYDPILQQTHILGDSNNILNGTRWQASFSNGSSMHVQNNFWDPPVNIGTTVFWDGSGTFEHNPIQATLVPGTLCSLEKSSAENAIELRRQGPRRTAVETPRDEVTPPADVIESSAYPNPFNPTATIRFVLPCAGVVTVKVYDSFGRTVSSIPAGHMDRGQHEVWFDAHALPSGLYYYMIEFDGIHGAGKLLLAK